MAEKSVMVVGVDDSDLSYFALEWTLEHFFKVPEQSPFHLLVVHAQPLAYTGVALGPAASAIAILPHIDYDLKMVSERVIQKAKEICEAKSVNNVALEVVDGDARNVLCEAVEKHRASILVVGCHGHGAIKRAVLGSVSDYCAHHAHCSVMIVKKPKIKH